MSSDSMKNATATSHGRMRLMEGWRQRSGPQGKMRAGGPARGEADSLLNPRAAPQINRLQDAGAFLRIAALTGPVLLLRRNQGAFFAGALAGHVLLFGLIFGGAILAMNVIALTPPGTSRPSGCPRASRSWPCGGGRSRRALLTIFLANWSVVAFANREPLLSLHLLSLRVGALDTLQPALACWSLEYLDQGFPL